MLICSYWELEQWVSVIRKIVTMEIVKIGHPLQCFISLKSEDPIPSRDGFRKENKRGTKEN